MNVCVSDGFIIWEGLHTHTHTHTHCTLHSRFQILQLRCLLNNFRDYKFQKFYTPIGREVKLQQIFLLEYNVKRKKNLKVMLVELQVLPLLFQAMEELLTTFNHPWIHVLPNNSNNKQTSDAKYRALTASQVAWILMPFLHLTSCVTLDKWLNLLLPEFFHL